jgi:hypothetical protein
MEKPRGTHDPRGFLLQEDANGRDILRNARVSPLYVKTNLARECLQSHLALQPAALGHV